MNLQQFELWQYKKQKGQNMTKKNVDEIIAMAKKLTKQAATSDAAADKEPRKAQNNARP